LPCTPGFLQEPAILPFDFCQLIHANLELVFTGGAVRAQPSPFLTGFLKGVSDLRLKMLQSLLALQQANPVPCTDGFTFRAGQLQPPVAGLCELGLGAHSRLKI
jgi:hypothetical protein